MEDAVLLLRVGVAFWFVAGLLGRNLVIARARSSDDVRTMVELMELSGRFERLMVIPGSIAMVVAGLLAAWTRDIPWTGEGNWWFLASLALFVVIGLLVPTVFLPRGRVFATTLEEAQERGEVSEELRGALRDPAVRNARALELVVVAVILGLMVMKTF